MGRCSCHQCIELGKLDDAHNNKICSVIVRPGPAWVHDGEIHDHPIRSSGAGRRGLPSRCGLGWGRTGPGRIASTGPGCTASARPGCIASAHCGATTCTTAIITSSAKTSATASAATRGAGASAAGSGRHGWHRHGSGCCVWRQGGRRAASRTVQGECGLLCARHDGTRKSVTS
jgi:hypothetical protein